MTDLDLQTQIATPVLERPAAPPFTPSAGAMIVFHSVAMYHASLAARNRMLSAIEEAGSRATDRAPLAWLRMEGGYSYALLRLTPHEVWLTTWPGGEERRLATSGAHGKPVRWRV